MRARHCHIPNRKHLRATGTSTLDVCVCVCVCVEGGVLPWHGPPWHGLPERGNGTRRRVCCCALLTAVAHELTKRKRHHCSRPKKIVAMFCFAFFWVVLLRAH